jgi:hypothetical protein
MIGINLGSPTAEEDFHRKRFTLDSKIDFGNATSKLD